LLRDAVARYAERAAAAGLSLTLRVDGTLPGARWDAARLHQLLGNLLENSLRYTDAPGRIELTAHADVAAAEIVLMLDDSSPAVAPELLPHLFEPLFRAEASRNRHFGGSGLGLAIAEAIVHGHGGRIEASLSPLGGLRFVCRLPLDWHAAGDAA
jgi:two-component system sensor histidine kinase BaeS